MQASEARYITEQTEVRKAKEWWNKFSIELFEAIKRQAECRCYEIMIGEQDDLNSMPWIDCSYLRERVRVELEQLGYLFTYINEGGSSYPCVQIGWK